MVAIRITDDGAEIDPHPVVERHPREVAAESAHLPEGHRSLIASTLRTRGPGGDSVSATVKTTGRRLPKNELPTREELGRLFGVPGVTLHHADVVLRSGTLAVQELVRTGRLSIYTAARVAKELSEADQNNYARQVDHGADAVLLARRYGTATVNRNIEARRAKRKTGADPAVRFTYLDVPTVEGLVHTLAALDMIERGTDGLDPSITSEQAAQLLDGLSKGRAALQRVVKALTQRNKESTQP